MTPLRGTYNSFTKMHGLIRPMPAANHPPKSASTLILLLILLGIGAVVAAAGAPIDQLRQITGTHWYSLSLLGQRMGYAYRTIEICDDGDGLRETMEVKARVQLSGLQKQQEPLAFSDKTSIEYNRQLKPVSIHCRQDIFDRLTTTAITMEDDKMHIVIKDPAGRREKTKSVPDDIGSDLPLILDIINGKAKIGETIQYSMFVPDLGKFDRFTTKITDRINPPDDTEAFVLQTTQEALNVQTQHKIDTGGNMLSFSMPDPLALNAERVSRDQALAEVGALVLSNSIPTDSDLPDAPKLRKLKARIRPAREVDLQFLPTGPRQSVEYQNDNNDAVVTVTNSPPVKNAAKLPIDDPQFDEYFKPSAIAQSDSPAIRKKVRQIVAGETDALKAARSIVSWVSDNLGKKESEPRQLSALEILNQNKGDCTEHAILCGTLAAAAGIPARMAVGIVYVDGAFYYHAWNELYVGQWTEMDAAFGETSLDAGHIKFASTKLTREGIANGALSTGRTIDAIDIEILNVETTDRNAAEGNDQ